MVLGLAASQIPWKNGCFERWFSNFSPPPWATFWFLLRRRHSKLIINLLYLMTDSGIKDCHPWHPRPSPWIPYMDSIWIPWWWWLNDRWAVKHTMVDDGWWLILGRYVSYTVILLGFSLVLGDSNDHDFFVGWHQFRTFAAILSSPFSRWSRNSRLVGYDVTYIFAFVWPVESLGAHQMLQSAKCIFISLMIQAFGDMFWIFLGAFLGHFCFQHVQHWNWMKLDHSLWDWIMGDCRRLWDHMGRSKDQNRGSLRFDVCEHEPSILSHLSGIPSTRNIHGLSKKSSTLNRAVLTMISHFQTSLQLCVLDVYGQRTIERNPKKSPRLGLTFTLW